MVSMACGGGAEGEPDALPAPDAPPGRSIRADVGTCEPLWSIAGTAPGYGAILTALPDVGGDARPDLAVVTGDDARARTTLELRDGSTGGLLGSIDLEGGLPLSRPLVVPGGDAPALLVATYVPGGGGGGVARATGGATPPTDASTVRLLSLPSGEVRWQRSGATGMTTFGAALALTDDRDDDDAPDIVISSSGLGATVDGEPVASPLLVVSSATGADLATIPPPAGASYLFGAALSPAVDLDGVGRPDLVVGDPLAFELVGATFAIDGDAHEVLWDHRGEAAADLAGDALALLGDVDEDGAPDVAIGVHGFDEGTGRLVARSGRTGAALWQVDGRRDTEGFGFPVVTSSDFDGDGVLDVLVGGTTPGAPVAVLGQGGRVAVLSGATAQVLVDVGEVVSPTDTSGMLGVGLAQLAAPGASGRPLLIVGSPGESPGRIRALDCAP